MHMPAGVVRLITVKSGNRWRWLVRAKLTGLLSLPVAFLVLRDRELAQIAQLQSTAFGRKANSVLADYELAVISRGVGVECFLLQTDSEIDDVLREVAAILDSGAQAR